jgi:serine/threonine-protein kinase
VLGVGGSGVVYAAEHVLTGQALAVKAMLDPASGARLEREAKSLARLRSPHVVRVVDLGHDEGGPFLVMDRLEGATLRELLVRAGRLPLGVVASLVLQVADALDEAHASDLVHRDLKPENVRLRHPSGRDVATDPRAMDEHLHATLFDFGIVKPLDELGLGITATHTAVGTPNYMSLEQLRGDPGLDERSDVFALSVLVYECVTGELPFVASALPDLVRARLQTTPARLDTRAVGVPEPLADVIARGLAPTPDDRPSSVRALAGALAPYAPTSRAAWLARSRDPNLPPSLAAPGHVESEPSFEPSFSIGSLAASRHPTPTQLLAIDHAPIEPASPASVAGEPSTPSAMVFPPLPPGLRAFVDTGELPPADPRALPFTASDAFQSTNTLPFRSHDARADGDAPGVRRL